MKVSITFTTGKANYIETNEPPLKKSIIRRASSIRPLLF